MIPVSRLAVLVILSVCSLVGIPMALAWGQSPFDGLSVVIPVIVVIELVLYFFLTLFTNPRMSIATVAVLAVAMILVRWIGSIVAALLMESLMPNQWHVLVATGGNGMTVWMGHPPSVFIQILVLILSMPHILDAAAPSLIGSEVRDKLGSAPPATSRAAVPKLGGIMDTMPAGGFIQVFSYEELSGVLRKTQGLEGYIIYNSEGLIVWRDLPLRLELDALIAKLMVRAYQIGEVVAETGLARVRKVVVESRDHYIFVTQLNQNFGMLLVYNTQVSASECFGKLGVLAKSAREFLQWKYPGLPVTPAVQAENVMQVM
ncbi:hypothetical protein HZA57_01895 [Candidatus Poribacteria bacterium]|nr:hypothetical protein [Candidatus Poribacteria bacterium]